MNLMKHKNGLYLFIFLELNLLENLFFQMVSIYFFPLTDTVNHIYMRMFDSSI